jgi:hypothetical protein
MSVSPYEVVRQETRYFITSLTDTNDFAYAVLSVRALHFSRAFDALLF